MTTCLLGIVEKFIREFYVIELQEFFAIKSLPKQD